MAVIKRYQQTNVLGQQHAVAKYIARHVAYACHREGRGLGVVADGAEMPLDSLPGTTRRDTHLLMVITDRAAGRKRVAQPETVVRRNPVGDVGKGGGALVSRDHQIRVVPVVPNHIRGRHDYRFDDVVGEVEHARNQVLVAGNAFSHPGFALRHRRCVLGEETPFGADRDNDRVLDLLGFDQTQNLGAEVFTPIRPTHATTGNASHAQMHTFHAR